MDSHFFQFLERIDIFGLAVTFRIFSEKNHKTQFGGFITLIISSIIIYQLFSLVKFVIDQNAPNVIQQQNYVQQPEIFLIRPDTFSFAFGLQNPLGQHFKDETVYKVKSVMQTNTRVLNKETGLYELKVKQVDVKLKTCTMENFQIEEVQDYFKKLPLDKLYCFDLNEKEIGVEGEFSALIYKQLNIQVHECTDQTVCAEQSVRQKQLGSPRFGIYVSDNIVQVTDKERPFIPIGKNMFWVTGLNLQKEVRYQLLNNYIHTDVGLMTQDIKTERVVSYSSEREQVINRQSSLIYNFFFNYEKNKEIVYYRKYMKLDQAFSQVGGTFNVLVGLGCLLCWPISQLELNRKIINSIFQVDEEELSQDKGKGREKSSQDNMQYPQNKQNNKNRCLRFLKRKRGKQENLPKESQTTNTVINKEATTVGPEDTKRSAYKQTQDHIKKFFQFTFSEIKIKFSEYFMSYFNFFSFQNSPKRQIIKYGTDILYNHIDIFNIVNKLIEFEKLKHLLLTDNQLKLFEYLPKPTLQLSQIPKRRQSDTNRIQFQKRLTRSLSFQSIQHKSRGREQSLDQQTEYGLIFNHQKTLKEKAEEAYQAFYAICNNSNQKSKIDQKLMQMIDPKLVNYFIENQDNFNHLNSVRLRNSSRQESLNNSFKILRNQDTIKEPGGFLNGNQESTINNNYRSSDLRILTRLKQQSPTSGFRIESDVDECIINALDAAENDNDLYKRQVKNMNLTQIDRLNNNQANHKQINIKRSNS